MVGWLVASSASTGCGQKGALYLPSSPSHQVVTPAAQAINEPNETSTLQNPNTRFGQPSQQTTTQATTQAAMVGDNNDY